MKRFDMGPEMNAALEADDKKLRDLGAYDTSVGDVPAPTFGPDTEQRLGDFQQKLRASLDLMESAGRIAEREATLKLIDAAVEAYAGSSAHLAGARTALRELGRVIKQGRRRA